MEGEGRNRSRCPLNNTQEEEEGVEVEEVRRRKEELLKRSPSLFYGGAEAAGCSVQTV